MGYAFQTSQKLYLVLDYIPGGELYYHLKKQKRCEEDTARFFAAEIICALAHLHEKKVIYRDLKPENVLLDSSGHVKVTDFGLAKKSSQGADDVELKTFCGTPEYL